MMIIVDTNVISEFARQQPQPSVLTWLDATPPGQLWTTALSIMEVRFGIERLGDSRRRVALEDAMERLIRLVFADRILPFDDAAAHRTATLQAERMRVGLPIDLLDSMIAGIALVRRATLATRNTRHFADVGVPIVNPFDPAPLSGA